MSHSRKKKKSKKQEAQLRWAERYSDGWFAAGWQILCEFWQQFTGKKRS